MEFNVGFCAVWSQYIPYGTPSAGSDLGNSSLDTDRVYAQERWHASILLNESRRKIADTFVGRLRSGQSLWEAPAVSIQHGSTKLTILSGQPNSCHSKKHSHASA